MKFNNVIFALINLVILINIISMRMLNIDDFLGRRGCLLRGSVPTSLMAGLLISVTAHAFSEEKTSEGWAKHWTVGQVSIARDSTAPSADLTADEVELALR